MKNTSKLNTFLSTLNFVLCFVGYQLATSLLLPTSSDLEGISRTVTVPYRAFALIISLLVIFLNIKRKPEKTHLALKVLWVFWLALIIRIFYDTNIRTDVQIGSTMQLWLYIFGIVLPAMFSVLKSYQVIDLNKALKWVFTGTVITMLLSLFNNSSLLMRADEITGRVDANLALNTIGFGHIGTSGILLSLFLLSKGGSGLIKKVFLITVVLLSSFIMIRSGSRSPVVALVVVMLFWMFARGKNIVLGFSFTLIVALSIILFIDPILNLMGGISPVMESRLRAGIYENYSSGRDLLYAEAWNAFLDSPIFGKQFALFNYFGEFIYSHNIILDALMGLGLIGGLALIYILWISLKSSYRLIKIDDTEFWICLLLIQQIVMNMFSGAFYYNQLLNVLLVFIFLYYNAGAKSKKKNIQYA